MAGDEHELDLAHDGKLVDDLNVDRALAFGLQHRLVEIEQCLGRQGDLLRCCRRRRRGGCRWRRRRRDHGSRCGRRGLGHEVGLAFNDGHRRRPISRTPAQRVVDAGLAAVAAAAPHVVGRLAVPEQPITAVLRVCLAERRRGQHGGGRAGHDGCSQTKIHHFHPFGLSC